jgi:Ca-activated chloride channel family protein
MVTRTFLALSSFLLFSVFISNVYSQDDDQVIKVDSSIVVLNASITDSSGVSVSGLKQSQFRVFDDGVEQPVSFFAAEETPFAAAILLDSSGSMEQRVSLARSAAIKFLDGLRSDDVAAIYNFDSKVKQLQDFSNSRDLGDAFFDLKANGMTVLNDAIRQAAIALSARSEKRKAIIVLSDGEDTQSSSSAEKALKAALAVGVTIYTVDMSAVDTGGKQRMQNQGVLKNFAEKTGGIFISTPGGVAMRDAFQRIVTELGNLYTIGYQPVTVKTDGKWHALELRVSRPNLIIRTRKGYNAPRVKS